MYWKHGRSELMGQLPPEVSGYLAQVLDQVEAEGICDAPGVISGVVRHMRRAESEVIRAAVGRTEQLLASAFAHSGFRRISA